MAVPTSTNYQNILPNITQCKSNNFQLPNTYQVSKLIQAQEGENCSSLHCRIELPRLILQGKCCTLYFVLNYTFQ